MGMLQVGRLGVIHVPFPLFSSYAGWCDRRSVWFFARGTNLRNSSLVLFFFSLLLVRQTRVVLITRRNWLAACVWYVATAFVSMSIWARSGGRY